MSQSNSIYNNNWTLLQNAAAQTTSQTEDISEIESVEVPKYTDGDWFEFLGYDEEVVETLAVMLANGSAPLSIDVNWSTPLRVVYGARASCQTTTWTGECDTSTMTHGLNATLIWPTNSGYLNDTMLVNISLDVVIKEPADRRAFFTQRNGSIRIEAWFSAGGEDNHLEIVEEWGEERERLGDWPEVIKLSSVWSIEESIDRQTTRKTRVNDGIWNITENNHSETSSWTWQANGTVTAHIGNDSSEMRDSLRLISVKIDTDDSVEMLLDPSGFLLGSTVSSAGTPRSTLMLLNHSYRAEQHIEVVISDHGIGAFGWLAIIAAFTVGTGLLVATIRVANRAKEVAVTRSGMPRYVLDSIAGAVGVDIYDEIKSVTSEEQVDKIVDSTTAESDSNQPGGILARAEQRLDDAGDVDDSPLSDEFADG